MKTFSLILSMLCAIISSNAQKLSSIKLISETSNRLVVEMDLGEMTKQSINTSLGDFLQITCQGSSMFQKKGAPALPLLSKSIIVPNHLNAQVNVLESEFVEYHDIKLAPSKGHITRAVDPSTIPFTFGDEYQRDTFFPGQTAMLNKPFVFRDFRGQTIQFFPIQYNPIKQITKVYNRLKVEILFDGIATENVLTKVTELGGIVEEFEAIYINHFLNYTKNEMEAKGTRYAPITEIGSMLVVCPSIYLNAIQPFVKWKEMKGIKIFLVNTDTIGGGVSETSIKNLASNYYQKENIAYMLIVGDNTDIPALNENYTDSLLFGPSDIAYAYQTIPDHRPEFIVGRFSGNSIADIETQVLRTLNYEQNPKTIGSWMGTQLGIGSSLGPNDDNQYDYQHIHDIVDSNKNQYNYVTNVEMYDGANSRGGTDLAGNPTSSMLLNSINQGTSLINYAGHGAADGIVTCAFTTPDIASIQNENELPFFLVVGCQPGNFINGTSFSEAIIREGGVTPKGVISSYMSTVNQWIPEPMEMQDEFNAVMRGARPANVRNRLGALCLSGSLAMMDKYDTPGNDFGGSQMMDTWVFFGDPTVSLFNKFEGTLSVTNTAHVYQNQTFLDVNCPVEGATIGLYYQGKFLAVANVVGGFAHCTFPPITGLDTIFVTATKQNYVPAYSFSQTVDWALSVKDVEFENQFVVYPNPATRFLHVESKQNVLIKKFIIQDLSGRIILAEDMNSTNKLIDVSSLANGIYLVQIESAQGKFVSKFTKQ